MITLDEATHLYYEDGVLIENDSVTGILAREGYTNFDRVPDYKLLPAQKRGTHVHDTVKLSLSGELHYESTNPLLLEYLEQFNKFIEDYKADVVESELAGRSKVWGYTWRLDLVLRIEEKLCIFDIKTGHPTKAAALQLIAYKMGYEETSKNKIKGGRFCLELKPDKYGIFEYKDKADENIWKSIVTTHNARARYI